MGLYCPSKGLHESTEGAPGPLRRAGPKKCWLRVMLPLCYRYVSPEQLFHAVESFSPKSAGSWSTHVELTSVYPLSRNQAKSFKGVICGYRNKLNRICQAKLVIMDRSVVYVIDRV